MFAIPGLCGLLILMYLRPQEYFEVLQKVPLLYLFFAAAVGGLLIDLKLRLVKPVPTRALWIAVGFFVWLLINNGVKAPAAFMANVKTFFIVFMTYIVLCQSVQSFRAFRAVILTMISIGMFLTIVGVHQGSADSGCLVVTGKGTTGEGVADGRSCETVMDCLGLHAEPGKKYQCQRIGIWGTSALNDRVRYRGQLQDPNELSVVVVATLPFLIGLATRKKKFRYLLLMLAGGFFIGWCVINTQSRGGMLIFLGVLGLYFVKKFGAKYILVGVVAAIPVFSMGGRSSDSADESTEGRYEAWRAGLQMLQKDPIFGAGHVQFTQHHHLTAHNSYVLAFAEFGMIGMMLWVGLLYTVIKTAVVAIRDFAHDPRGPPPAWGMSILGMTVAYCVQMFFLSLTYHTITWIFFGISGAFYSAIKSHRPDWEVKLTYIDLGAIVIGCFGFVLVLLPLFLRMKGF